MPFSFMLITHPLSLVTLLVGLVKNEMRCCVLQNFAIETNVHIKDCPFRCKL